jgi:hypothetical protein
MNFQKLPARLVFHKENPTYAWLRGPTTLVWINWSFYVDLQIDFGNGFLFCLPN